MPLFQIHGALGGCGASAVAWTVAQQVRADVAVDFSAHQGGLAWCAAGDTDVSWPRILVADIQREELLAVSRTVDGIVVCSGGQPPPQTVVQPVLLSQSASGSVVIDSGEKMDGAVTLTVMPNHLRAMKRMKGHTGWVLCSLAADGVPTSLVQRSLPDAVVIFFKQQSKVHKSLQLGYAMPRSSAMRSAVSEWLSHVGK